MKNLILLISLILFSVKSYAVKVVAVVNDEIITDYDVEQHHKIMSKISQNNKSNAKLNNEVIKGLVDIYLFEYYANLIGINITDSQVNRMKEDLEQQNGLKKGYFSNLMNNDVNHIFNKYLKNSIIVNSISSQIAQNIEISVWESNFIKNNINLEVHDFVEGILLSSDKSINNVKKMQNIHDQIHDCDKLREQKLDTTDFSGQVKDLDSRIQQALDLNKTNSIIYEDNDKYHSYAICKYNSIADENMNQQIKNLHINKQVTQQINKLLYQVKYNAYVKFI